MLKSVTLALKLDNTRTLQSEFWLHDNIINIISASDLQEKVVQKVYFLQRFQNNIVITSTKYFALLNEKKTTISKIMRGLL